MSAQKEQLKAIAAKLSEERQKKSISLEEIAARTYIPQRLLIAIEDANLDRLPEPVFIQGFIRRFGDAIGLDGIALSKEFTVNLSPLPAPTTASLISNTIEPQAPKPIGLQTPKTPEPPPAQRSEALTPLPTPKAPEPPAIRDPQPPVPKVEPAAIRDSVPEPKISPNEPPSVPKVEPTAVRDAIPEPRISPNEPPSVPKVEPTAVRDAVPAKISTDESPSRLPLIALAAAIGLGVIGVLASTFANRPAERTPVAATSPAVKPVQPPVAPPKSSAPASPTVAVSPSPSASPSPTGPVNVKMNITEDSWVSVVVDGNVAYEGTLTKGTQKTWSGNQVVVDSGNAGGVSLSYNNGAAKAMGAPGEVQAATFPPTP